MRAPPEAPLTLERICASRRAAAASQAVLIGWARQLNVDDIDKKLHRNCRNLRAEISFLCFPDNDSEDVPI